MSDIAITAAACLAEGRYGSHRSPLRPRPAMLTWSSLFTSPCPRFGRMDPLCKLGLAAVELMGVEFSEKETTGVCLGTPDGSWSVDEAFWKEPSPALFTYTLPSTLVGEICIRYGLKGPNLCLMLSRADSVSLLEETAEWLRQGEASAAVCVFANAVKGSEFAFALYLEKEEEALRRGRVILQHAEGDVQEICESLCRHG